MIQDERAGRENQNERAEKKPDVKVQVARRGIEASHRVANCRYFMMVKG
jgi:hypothetical protein